MVPKVSVIIVVKKDERLIRCLWSLLKAQEAERDFEIIVVENGSTNLKAICSSFPVKYIHLEKACTPAARNSGLWAAKGKYVLYIDADCIAGDNWVNQIVQFLECQPDFVAAGGRILRFEPNTRAEIFGSNLVGGQRALSYLPFFPQPYIVTANAAFHKNALIEIGGFDENLQSGSDVDVCFKLGTAGYRIGICTDAVVFHENRSNSSTHFYRFYKYAKYHCLLFKITRFRHNKYFYINSYPYYCIRKAFRMMVVSILKGKVRISTFWKSYYLLIEGLGVLAGNISGSIKFRVFYL